MSSNIFPISSDPSNFISKVNLDLVDKIVILIKKDKTFYTRIENLHRSKSTTTLLVGIFAAKLAPAIHNDILSKFDAVFYYKEELNAESGPISFERELDKGVVNIVKSFLDEEGGCNHKIRLIVTEDCLLYGAALLREKYKIPGPKTSELVQFYDKAVMKRMITGAANIPTAKYMIMDLERPIDEVLTQVGTFCGSAQFPMFRKPTQGDGSVDSGRVEHFQELQNWAIERHGQNGVWKEFVDGREFWASVLLLSNGTIVPHMIVHFSFANNDLLDVPTNTGMPIKSVCRRFEDFEDEFPNMFEFVGKVVDALKPRSPNNFVVQGFQLQSNTALYMFTESAYRQGGPSTAMSYITTGISTETAILSLLLEEDDDDGTNMKSIVPDPAAAPLLFAAQIRWPSRPGKLVCADEMPPSVLPHGSSLKMTWNYRPNDHIEKAIYTTDFTALASMTNEDKHKLVRDVDYLAENWKPNME